MPLSAEHKRKISQGLIKYHSSCKAKKPKSQIEKEISRLQRRADTNIKQSQKNQLKKEITKLKNMIK
jgi:hypothetical protein